MWTFWLCHLISPKRNEFLQRIFLTKLLPTVCNTPTKFQTDSSKNEKKSLGVIFLKHRKSPHWLPFMYFFFGTSITVKNQGLILPFYFFSCSKGLEKKSCRQILNFYGILGGWGPKGRSQWFFMDFFDFVVEFLGK